MEFKPFRLGDYLLLERLATGGMAEVYRGKLRGAGGFEKQLAIKRILPHYSSNDEFVRMFEFEARLSSQLTHANIVQIFNFQKISGAYLLTMEFVNGKNLRQFVNKVKRNNYALSVACAVYIVNEVCKGLDYAHSRRDESEGKPLNIIHRDMSPQNVMLSYEGAVKIVDFGIAKARDRADETRSGVIKGKFGYMSPEQANGEGIDSRTDIFSTGIMLYELVTGKRLFQTDNDLATLKMIQECAIPLPTKANPKITLELEKIILRALSKDRSVRFQTAGLMHRALQEFLNKNFSGFTQRELADILHAVFVVEMETEQKRSEEINRQSIPFSQGSTALKQEEDPVPAEKHSSSVQEESVTKFEKEEDTGFTSGEDSDLIQLLKDMEENSKTNKSGASSSQVSKNSSTQRSLEKPTEAKTSVRKKQEDAATEIKTIIKKKSEMEHQSDFTNFTGDEELPLESKAQEATVVTKKEAPQNKPVKKPLVSPTRQNSAATPTLPNMSGPAKSLGSSYTKGGPKQMNTDTISPKLLNTGSVGPNSMQTSTDAKKPLNKDTEGNFKVSLKQPKIDLDEESEGWKISSQANQEQHNHRSPFSFVNLLVIAVLLVTAQQIYQRMQIQIPVIVETVTPERPVAEVPTPVPNTNNSPLAAAKNPPYPTVQQEKCTLRAESDPPGATWSIDGIDKGNVGVAFVPCGAWVYVVVKKNGYDDISNRIKSSKKMREPYRFNLKPISEGLLEFKLNYRAKIFVDGQEIKTYESDQSYQLALPAKKTVKLRFVNETLGIDSMATVTLRKDVVERIKFKIDELPKYEQ